MARRLDHRRDALQPDLYHQRELQGEATSADTPDDDKGSRGRRESSVLSQLCIALSVFQCSPCVVMVQ